MTEPQLLCLDCRRTWSHMSGPFRGNHCPSCGSTVTVHAIPWSWISARATRYLRHRLAHYTAAEISEAYGCSENSVYSSLRDAKRSIRRRSQLRMASVQDLIVYAAQDNVPLLSLPETGANVAPAVDTSGDATHIGVSKPQE